MKSNIFTPDDILVPSSEYCERWSVIACDQFSSQPEYWERVREFAGDAPSTLNLIIPEAYLSTIDEKAQIESINDAMEKYIKSGILTEARKSFIYVERALPNGKVRKGLIGTIDLEEYDFAGKSAVIRASEGTILERLPARVNIRKAVPLELPHIIAFIDDKDETVIEPLAARAETLPNAYDFDLMEGGGHIRGRKVAGSDVQDVTAAIDKLQSGSGETAPLMIIGDGNHSLAGAKVYWDELKQTLSAEERESHPARRALVEVCNVYDPAIDFEAIHRVLFGVDARAFIDAFEDATPRGSDYVLQWVSKEGRGETGIKAACIGDMLVMVQNFIDEYIAQTPGSTIDYIHGADSVRALVESERSVGLILPAMDKSDLFKTVTITGVFPRKSFSVGEAKEKRYYLECRKIK